MTTHRERTQVCVVGSGAGGAVVAKELAERGARVLVLEEGPRVGKEDFTSRILDAFSLLYRDRAMTGVVGRPAIPIPTGRCVGGSTVVNMGNCLRPPPRFFQECARLGLSSFTQAALVPQLERVEAFLNVHPVESHLLGDNGRLVARGAEQLGLPWEAMPRAHRDCQGCGHCSLGCPKDAKQAMHITYVPSAEALGARIYSQRRVTELVTRRGRVSGVRGTMVGPGGGPEGEFEVQADTVVLAAGALHTPALLLANRVGDPNGHLGRHLRIHPVARVRGLFDEVIEGWRGVPQSVVIDRLEQDGILLHNTFLALAAEATAIPGFGREHWELIRRYRHLGALVVHLADRSSGKVRVGFDHRIKIDYRLGREDVLRLLNGIVLAARILFAAGASTVLLPIRFHEIVRSPGELDQIDLTRISPPRLKLAAFHPHGTCRMGADARAGVVDDSFRVYGLECLYVADASVIPTPLDVGPQLTVMAAACLAAERIVSQL